MKYNLPFTGKRDRSLDDGGIIGFSNVMFQGEKYDMAAVDLASGSVEVLRMENGAAVGFHARIVSVDVKISETLFRSKY
jgi:hypothetical protein